MVEMTTVVSEVSDPSAVPSIQSESAVPASATPSTARTVRITITPALGVTLRFHQAEVPVVGSTTVRRQAEVGVPVGSAAVQWVAAWVGYRTASLPVLSTHHDLCQR